MHQIEKLLQEALEHKAINHPYLLALENGEFRDTKVALKDFAVQYSGYTEWFPKYLTAAISKMNNAEHRSHLIDNLSEESGQLDKDELKFLGEIGIKTEWVNGIPHPELFKRFCQSIDIESDNSIDINVEIWRELFLNVMYNGTAAEAIGAIGLGTESVVKHIYKFFTNAIQRHTDLRREDYVFFELHSEIDDEHGKIMIQIAEDFLNESLNNYNELRKGMLKALNLRVLFWDMMYERAKNLNYENRKEYQEAL